MQMIGMQPELRLAGVRFGAVRIKSDQARLGLRLVKHGRVMDRLGWEGQGGRAPCGGGPLLPARVSTSANFDRLSFHADGGRLALAYAAVSAVGSVHENLTLMP